MNSFIKYFCCVFLSLLFASTCYAKAVSNLGAESFYKVIYNINNSSQFAMSDLEQKNNVYSFSISNSIYGYGVAFGIDSAGYVSELSISTYLPQKVIENFNENDKTSGQMYRELYNYLRSEKYGPRASESVALKKATEYQQERINKIIELFNLCGVFGNGIMNSYGVDLLYKISEEDAELFAQYDNFYNKLYLSPKEASMRGINERYINHALLKRIVSEITPMLTGLGLSASEINTLVASFNKNSGNTFCSKTDRMIYMQVDTDSRGDSVDIKIYAL